MCIFLVKAFELKENATIESVFFSHASAPKLLKGPKFRN